MARLRNGLITELGPDEVFVFGSNLAGRHGRGAALQARRQFGAQLGVGEGLTGSSYALPTKDEQLQVRGIEQVGESIFRLGQTARELPGKKFYLTRVGQGLAGFDESSIRQKVVEAKLPPNVIPWWEFEQNRAEKAEPFKLIIAGGRDFQDYDRLKAAVERQLYNANIPISPESLTVISGLAKGADTLGMQWAKEVGVPVLEFPASWGDVQGRKPYEVGVRRDGSRYWKGAGHARNRQMAEAGDAVILFPGGAGTENMAKTAQQLGLQVWDARQLDEPIVPAQALEQAVADLSGTMPASLKQEAEDAAAAAAVKQQVDALVQEVYGDGPKWAAGLGGVALLGGAALLLQEQEKKEQQKQLELQLNQSQ